MRKKARKSPAVRVVPAVTPDPLSIGMLARSIRAPLSRARKKDAEARWATWDVSRRIIEHASLRGVAAAAQEQSPQGAGRPRSPHVLVMEALAAETGLGLRTLHRWMAEWLAVATVLGVAPGIVEKEFTATMAKNSKPEQVETLLAKAFPEQKGKREGNRGSGRTSNGKGGDRGGDGNGGGSDGEHDPAPYSIIDGARPAKRTILIGPSMAEAQRHLIALGHEPNLRAMLAEGVVLALAGSLPATAEGTDAPYIPSLRAKATLKKLGHEGEKALGALEQAAAALPQQARVADPKSVSLGKVAALNAEDAILKRAIQLLTPNSLVARILRGQVPKAAKKPARARKAVRKCA